MSTSEPTQTPAALPTPADAQAILEAARSAAQDAKNAADAATRAAQGAARRTVEQFPDMPEALVKQISDASAHAVVELMRAEFELANPNPTQPTAEGSSASTTNESGENGTPGASDTEPALTPEPRKTIAQRILGG